MEPIISHLLIHSGTISLERSCGITPIKLGYLRPLSASNLMMIVSSRQLASIYSSI